MIALLQRDLLLAVRAGGGFGLGVAFFLIVVVLVPLGIGPDMVILSKVSVGVLWVGALLATFAPKIRVGTYRGKTSKDNSNPPLLIPTVKDAPKAPIADRAGVPINKDITTHFKSLTCNPSSKPRIGETTTNGSPVVIQCENAFIVTTASKGIGDVSNSSSVPSS